MKIEKLAALALSVLIPALFSGCASYPIAKNLRQEAQPLSLIQVKANPQSTRGAVVIWGGRILNTVNSTNGGEIYVLALPLNARGKPCPDDTDSPGRFIAQSPEFLDPATYRPGRCVTVAGSVAGNRTERLQDMMYDYPLLKVEQIHLWAQPTSNDYNAYPAWYWGYNPWWWDGAVNYSPAGDGGFHDADRDDSRGGGPPR